jgi:hypothetical protein
MPRRRGARGHGEQPEVQLPVPGEHTDVPAGPGGDHGSQPLAGLPVDGHPDLGLGRLRGDVAQGRPVAAGDVIVVTVGGLTKLAHRRVLVRLG